MMKPIQKRTGRVAVMAGMLLILQCCCCVIPVRLRNDLEKPTAQIHYRLGQAQAQSIVKGP